MSGIKSRYLFVAILSWLFIVTGPAKADISQTFNMKGLAALYSLSCDQQKSLRRLNMPPPYFQGRPKAFLNDSQSLVLYSPHLTQEQRKTAEQLFASVPQYALPLAHMGGVVYVFARRSIVEAVPALAVEESWFGDFGLYMGVERRLYFPFESGEGITKKSDGTYQARRFTPSQREPFRIINHETGHMIDSLLGEYSLNSMGEDGYYRLSNRKDFLQALELDFKRLKSKYSPLRQDEIKRLGYYMPPQLGGIHPSEQRARREIFAELWAEVQGYDSNNISKAYPNAFTVVRKFNGFLRELYFKNGLSCKL